MEDIEVEPYTSSNEREAEAKNISLNIAASFRCVFISFCIFCFVALILFIWQQWKDLSFSECINSSLFGNFGDFVGGVSGAIIAFYSVYMLVRIFQDQITTNANVVKANESSIETNKNTIESKKKIIEQTQLQIFDSRFNLLLSLYHKAKILMLLMTNCMEETHLKTFLYLLEIMDSKTIQNTSAVL